MPNPNEEIWRASEKVFKEKWNFPHCVAVINGKHVRIKAPAHGGSEFFNYKKYHSVVLLVLVDGKKNSFVLMLDSMEELVMEMCIITALLVNVLQD